MAADPLLEEIYDRTIRGERGKRPVIPTTLRRATLCFDVANRYALSARERRLRQRAWARWYLIPTEIRMVVIDR